MIPIASAAIGIVVSGTIIITINNTNIESRSINSITNIEPCVCDTHGEIATICIIVSH